MSEMSERIRSRPGTLAKRVHRDRRAPWNKIMNILERTGCSGTITKRICTEIAENCQTCIWTRTLIPSKRYCSHTCVSNLMKMVILTLCLQTSGSLNTVYYHVLDKGIVYSKAAIVTEQSTKIMISLLESICIHQHGTPVSFSAKCEFIRARMTSFLMSQGIWVSKRPAQR